MIPTTFYGEPETTIEKEMVSPSLLRGSITMTDESGYHSHGQLVNPPKDQVDLVINVPGSQDQRLV